MRPLRLELAGFTAFREPVKVDFTDADLFALVGATGSGKTTILDAVVFSLYGSVPRLGERAVAPVVSTDKLEARVRFDFAMGGREYSALRIVRRTKGSGATTKEARLECGDDVLAGDADGVTAAVRNLFGLDFKQFTKAVMLPQGDFARLLHDRPADRQDLLVRLLDLGLYERMRSAAGAREGAAADRARLLDGEMARLAGATSDALAHATGRIAALERLVRDIDDAQPALDALAQRERDAEERRGAAAAQAAALAAVRAPQDAATLAQSAAAAAEQARAAQQRAVAAEEAAAVAEQAFAVLGDVRPWQDAEAALRERAALTARVAKGEPILVRARADADAAAAHLSTAEARLAAAEEDRDRIRRAHTARDLAAHLAVGEACPVCAQTVTALPDRGELAELDAAEAKAASARDSVDDARRAANASAEARVKAEQTMASLLEQIADLDHRLDSAPSADPAEIARHLLALHEAKAAVAAARDEERRLRAEARSREAASEEATRRLQSAWSAFDTARDGVAALGPPPVDRSDLAAAWSALVAWASDEVPRREEAAAAAGAQARAAAAEQDLISQRLLTRCAECAVTLRAGQRPRDASADALAAARAERDRIAGDLERAEQLRTQQEALREQAVVAGALARHLSSKGFEQWLLDETLDRLAAGATDRLRTLSDGQYSLTVDGQRNFAVIDHRSADSQRPARTLSGGETFLASLALALTLSEHLAQLTVATAGKLESIFLDEGFGTLDAATLDVVASAIEELGATGRTVGIVTHVADLADRVPVRYEVTKGPSGSTVERVDR